MATVEHRLKTIEKNIVILMGKEVGVRNRIGLIEKEVGSLYSMKAGDLNRRKIGDLWDKVQKLAQSVKALTAQNKEVYSKFKSLDSLMLKAYQTTTSDLARLELKIKRMEAGD